MYTCINQNKIPFHDGVIFIMIMVLYHIHKDYIIIYIYCIPSEELGGDNKSSKFVSTSSSENAASSKEDTIIIYVFYSLLLNMEAAVNEFDTSPYHV